jgi:hypothetical protein
MVFPSSRSRGVLAGDLLLCGVGLAGGRGRGLTVRHAVAYLEVPEEY